MCLPIVSWFLTGCCEKNLIEEEMGGKGGSLPLPQGKRPVIGRKLARSTSYYCRRRLRDYLYVGFITFNNNKVEYLWEIVPTPTFP